MGDIIAEHLGRRVKLTPTTVKSSSGLVHQPRVGGYGLQNPRPPSAITPRPTHRARAGQVRGSGSIPLQICTARRMRAGLRIRSLLSRVGAGTLPAVACNPRGDLLTTCSPAIGGPVPRPAAYPCCSAFLEHARRSHCSLASCGAAEWTGRVRGRTPTVAPFVLRWPSHPPRLSRSIWLPHERNHQNLTASPRIGPFRSTSQRKPSSS